MVKKKWKSIIVQTPLATLLLKNLIFVQDFEDHSWGEKGTTAIWFALGL